mgnify:CR=1 FL=1
MIYQTMDIYLSQAQKPLHYKNCQAMIVKLNESGHQVTLSKRYFIGKWLCCESQSDLRFYTVQSSDVQKCGKVFVNNLPMH